ncbi:MAG: trypsin-like peptidase domain-containing protein [Planctomycetota bacterium]|nr:trypsin-like peptidase domain-containing protein [Planctomycetota bacterium]
MILDLFRGFRVPEQTIRGTGSGFFVSAKGFIITNYHVVAGAEKITVNLADDRVLEAEVRGEAPNLDLAVVKVEGEGYPFLEFGDSDEMRIGETVLAIGSPFGYRHTVTAGIVSAQAYVDMKNTQLEDFIQTDAAVNPGNSGGPLLNLEGKVVGVNTAISSKSGGYDGISFAIPSNFVSFAYSSLRKEGKIEGGFVGVGIDDV